MESFLNLLWLLMALTAFGVWRSCWVRQRREERRDPLKEWTSVVCMLVFLFFAVSLTDDLRSDLAVFDECSAGRRHAAEWVCPHHPSHHEKASPSFAMATLPRITLFESLHFASRIAPGSAPTGGRIEDNLILGRAPPVSIQLLERPIAIS